MKCDIVCHTHTEKLGLQKSFQVKKSAEACLWEAYVLQCTAYIDSEWSGTSTESGLAGRDMALGSMRGGGREESTGKGLTFTT